MTGHCASVTPAVPQASRKPAKDFGHFLRRVRGKDSIRNARVGNAPAADMDALMAAAEDLDVLGNSAVALTVWDSLCETVDEAGQ